MPTAARVAEKFKLIRQMFVHLRVLVLGTSHRHLVRITPTVSLVRRECLLVEGQGVATLLAVVVRVFVLFA